jgi:hypothetical protein
MGGGGGPGGGGDPAGPDAGCDSGVPFTVVEQCDGINLGGATCASLGFPGGALACDSACFFATNQCETCLPGPNVATCRHTELDAAEPSALAMTTTDQEIVVAWISGPGLATSPSPTAAASVRLARFGADLSLIAQSSCFGPAHARNIALARSPSGFILAVEGDGGVTIQPLDSTGAPRAASRVIANALQPVLGAREASGTMSGGPLLAWSVAPGAHPNPSGLAVQAELLGDDGTQETAPVTVFPVAEGTGYASAVFTGDGFLLADGSIARVGLDGSVVGTSAPGPAEYTMLAWTGTEARVVYGDPAAQGAGVYWLRLDKSGAALGSPVLLTPSSTFYNVAPAVAMGDDTVVVLGGGSSTIDHSTHLGITRISPTGTSLTAPFGVVQDPELVAAPKVAVLGSQAVLAWVGGVNGYPGRIGLALLNP